MRLLEALHRRLSLVWKIVLANISMMALSVLVGTLLTNRVTFPVPIVLLAVFALLGALDYVVVRVATVPLRVLTGVVNDVEAGVFDVTAPADAPDPDVRQVAKALNRLLLSLSEQRRNFTRRVFEAEERERREIAQRLHDGAVQTLALQQIRLGLLAKGDMPPDVRRTLDDIADLGTGAIEELRSVIKEIRPTMLDELGLVPAISAFLKERTTPVGVGHHFTVVGDVPALPPHVEAAVFRTIQEAVHNVLRHAQAKHLAVTVEVTRTHMHVGVEDDGVGISPGGLAHPGLGVLGMRERASLLGGVLRIGARRQGGTRVELVFPLKGTGSGPRTPGRLE